MTDTEELLRLKSFVENEIPGGRAALSATPVGPTGHSPVVELIVKLLRERVIAADVPVFVLKGTDALALSAIRYYKGLCQGNGLHDQAKEVTKAVEEMGEWQDRNSDRVKPPTHKHVPVPQENQDISGGKWETSTIEPGHITPKE